MSEIKIPKKLIEVALPLDEINTACAHEKMPGIGPHPRGIHLWWARRPLAAARAIIFAQMVNDPSETVLGDKRLRETKLKIQSEREKLFEIIRELVKWKNINNETVFNRALAEIKASWRFTCELNKNHPNASKLFNPEKLPAHHDPFAGGGAIPLEAQRLGLESYASDLNPVAVMINKAMIEIPQKFKDQAPFGPLPEGEKQSDLITEWSGIKGLVEDVRRYGYQLHELNFKRNGHLYPRIEVTKEMAEDRPDLKKYIGQKLKVITWLWARTVKSPNPAYSNIEIPLVKSFEISSKKGKEAVVELSIEGNSWSFKVVKRKATAEEKKGTVTRSGARCVFSGSPVPFTYLRDKFKQDGQKFRLMAVVAEGKRERVYLSPTSEIEELAINIPSVPFSNVDISHWPGRTNVVEYGMTRFENLFTKRQLLTLTGFLELLADIRGKIYEDTVDVLPDDARVEYANAIITYLSFCIDRCTDFNNSLTGWRHGNEKIMYLFGRQSIPMVWDFGEANIFENVVGGFLTNLEYQVKCLLKLPSKGPLGYSVQADATNQKISRDKVISTDPPYYDNIGYADLSDFFYVWMRPALRDVYPSLFGTLAVPKQEELVATPHRHGGKVKAEDFFLNGMTKAISQLAENAHPTFPVTIYYAFKQSETKEENTSNKGWETFLTAVIESGFSIDGTWPIRSEQSSRMIGMGSNALASSVVLVCNKRESKLEPVSRRQFQRELRDEMPRALEIMIGGNGGVSPIAPVDLAQAAIGPGIAIFSKYRDVLESDGSSMTIHDALILINKSITEYLNPDSANFDSDTLFCDDWFSQYGWSAGSFGEADTLARAKGTSVDGVKEAGVIDSGAGKVRLLKWSEYPTGWDPKTDDRTPVWEACHQMIRVLNQQGEANAGALLARMPEQGEHIRQLAYHLYTLCERKKWAEEARAYNELIGSWHAIVAASQEAGERGSQSELGFDF